MTQQRGSAGAPRGGARVGSLLALRPAGPDGWDRAAAATSLAVATAVELGAVWEHDAWATHPVLRWLGILVASGALLWRRTRFPLAALVVIAATVLSTEFAALFFLAYAAGRYQRARNAWLFGAAACAELLVITLTGAGPPLVEYRAPSTVVMVVSLVAMTVVAGTALRQRAEEGAQAETAARQRAVDAVNAERGRLVREFHDLLGHDVALLNILVESLRTRGDLPPEAQELLAAAQKQCAAASGHLRSMTTALRLRELDAAPRTPAGPALGPDPAAADLALLAESLESVRASGTEVRLDDGLTDAFARLPGAHRDTVRRVVTEALTNALRHAPGAAVRLALRTGPADWTLEIGNGPPRTAPRHTAPGTGLGLAGLRARVGHLGGTLAATPTDDGGFVVRARVPLTDDTYDADNADGTDGTGDAAPGLETFRKRGGEPT
ncbi:sensor histidine kinase [Streptomyces sp. NPDC059009]|uniref:sensor histidine kinase n=1 Tax=Streptomyces sp. NPDC059009 TaxID=3346694 RepID=UPI0036BC46BE